MLKWCYAIFWMYGSKNILFMLPLFKKRQSHKFSNLSYLGSRKVLPSAKIMISGQKCHNLKYLCAKFGYDWTKNKEMMKGTKSPTNVRLKAGKNFLKELLIKKIFSKQILSWKFKIELYLNRWLVLKIMIFTFL